MDVETVGLAVDVEHGVDRGRRLAQALPIVVFGMFAGSMVDRVDRRKFYL